MKVSVVIPVYNEQAYIGACLDSLLRQEEPPDEIIVVNNNSTDNTIKIARKYNVKLVNERKQGMIPARNRGFNEAKYEIIARTDADTLVPPDWIKKIKKNFRSEKLIALSGPAHLYPLPNLVQTSNWLTVSVFNFCKKILGHDCLYGANMTIRKSAWEKVKNEVCLDDSQVHEDLDLAVHLAPYGRIKFDKNLVVSSSARRWKYPESYFEYAHRVVKLLKKHKKFDVSQKSTQLVKKIVSKAFLTDQKSSY